jgi:predicted DNA binding CopG/RHH family protein
MNELWSIATAPDLAEHWRLALKPV